MAGTKNKIRQRNIIWHNSLFSCNVKKKVFSEKTYLTLSGNGSLQFINFAKFPTKTTSILVYVDKYFMGYKMNNKTANSSSKKLQTTVVWPFEKVGIIDEIRANYSCVTIRKGGCHLWSKSKCFLDNKCFSHCLVCKTVVNPKK